MKKSYKSTIIVVSGIILVVGVGIAFVFAGNDPTVNSVKDSRVTFVAGAEGKMWYIKSKDCSNEVYENTESKNIFDTMCRAYTTDGEFVYYDGVRDISPTPVVLPPMIIIDGKVATSSLPSPRRKQGPVVIENADPETFEIISSDYLDPSLSPEKSPTLTYARDKNFLYREGELVDGADPNTLLILGRGYIKDKNSVYYRGKKMEGSDADTFEFLEYGGYARDKNFVYLAWSGEKIDGSDGATFELLGSSDYAKDSGNTYYMREKIPDTDPKTFELLFSDENNTQYTQYSGYARDKNTVYYKGKKVEGTDSSEFTIVGAGRMYVKDNNFVYSYYKAERFPGIDAKTFEYVGNFYFKDKNNVYFSGGKVFEGIDPNTFEIIGDGAYAKDKDNVWKTYYEWNGEYPASEILMEGADTATFVFLKNYYAKDKNFVYLHSWILPDADPVSVEILENGYAKDKNSVYFTKEKVQGVDPATFEIIDRNYTKDSSFVYYAGARIDGAESEMFEVMKGNYAKDSSSVYYKGKQIEDADVETFEVDLYGQTARDKNTNYIEGKPVTARDMTNRDVILSPGFEKTEDAIVVPAVPFGLEDIEIQEMYPIGL